MTDDDKAFIDLFLKFYSLKIGKTTTGKCIRLDSQNQCLTLKLAYMSNAFKDTLWSYDDLVHLLKSIKKCQILEEYHNDVYVKDLPNVFCNCQSLEEALIKKDLLES